MAKFAMWLANTSPDWAVYQAIMANCMVAFDKCPGVHPLGIGEILRRLIAKMVIEACGGEVRLNCGVANLCTGLQAGIEGGIHAADVLFKEHQSDVNP